MPFDINRILTSEKEISVPQAAEMILPEYVAKGSGEGTFNKAVDTEYAFDAIVSKIKAISADSEAFASEVADEQCKIALAEYPSVQLVFSYNMDFGAFCRIFGLESLAAIDQFTDFDALAFSDAAKDSLFVRSGDKKYRIIFGEDRSAVDDICGSLAFSDEVYYPSADILGGNSDALISLYSVSSLKPCAIDPGEDPEARQQIAEAIFGETLDFVRRFSDSFGSVTYMYGYGEKTLTANTDGSYEYKASMPEAQPGSFYDDLCSALVFVAGCGGWDEDNSEFKLTNTYLSGAGRSGIRHFSFSQYIDGIRVAGEESQSIELELCGGQVCRYFRKIVQAAKTDEAEASEIAETANVIANNCNHIYNISTGSMMSLNSEDALEYVVNELHSVSQGYFRNDQGGMLRPCSIVRLKDGSRFYFDLYSASPLGFSRQE